jgi:hypothetical protein
MVRDQRRQQLKTKSEKQPQNATDELFGDTVAIRDSCPDHPFSGRDRTTRLKIVAGSIFEFSATTLIKPDGAIGYGTRVQR